MASPLIWEKAVLGFIPTALSNSHASVARPRGGRRARLAVPRLHRDGSRYSTSQTHIGGSYPLDFDRLSLHDTSPGQSWTHQVRAGILEVESVTRYCNKENIRRMTLQLCYFRSRGNILRFPLWTTAAHLCQLHHSLSSPTRRSTNFSNPSAIIDCFTLRPTHGSSTTLCPGPHAGSTGTARTLPKPRARPSATLALLSTPGLPILASGGLGSSALHPRFAHSGLRRGSDLLASHRLHSDSVSPARPRQPGSGPGRLGPEPDRAG